ncbi:hypothetical protein ABZY57_04435 [Streptomyces sp. NPDC006450]|uniref:hypothetical protein n=1 Tax=Streptomyces sp. NPDC006450 TaxID=3155458 RepID=UPI0033B94CD4
MGEWAAEDTARRTYRRWLGLYGSTAVIRLIEETAVGRQVLRTWTDQGETVTEPASRS